jgi:hypothetical protein
MKRDMDLVRKIVFALEEHPSGFAPNPLKIDGYTDEQIGYHVHIMAQAGLIDALDGTTAESLSQEAFAQSLRWAGHEFAAAARSDTIWAKAKKQIKEKAGSVTIEVMTEYLKHLGKEALGIA